MIRRKRIVVEPMRGNTYQKSARVTNVEEPHIIIAKFSPSYFSEKEVKQD
jgi:hypothetical protein